MAGKKYYAVAAGRSRGIYSDWPSAERQVRGYPGAKYKGFADEAAARAWLDSPAPPPSPTPAAPAGTVVVYTDGGCSNNPGPGGYGVVIEEEGRRRELSGGFRRTTNNRMEMFAAIVALEALSGCRSPILLYSDSAYLVNGINKGWARGWRAKGWRKSDGAEALNRDLWQCLLDLLTGLAVQFFWVRGHAGNQGNERCDFLAVNALRQPNLPVDAGYETLPPPPSPGLEG